MRIVNDVRWGLGRDAYERASTRFVEMCDSCGVGRDQIGFFGAVGFPGVSDLDALVVGDQATLVRLAALHREEARKSDVYGYLFWHEPLWILEEVKDDAYRLHTMDGLKRADGRAELSVAGVVSEEARRVLDVAWLIFLLGAVAEMGCVAKGRRGLSLRLLLLVHKNLRHSMRVFRSADNTRGDGLMGANELRQWAKERCQQGNEAEAGRVVWAQIVGSLAEACAGMDATCERLVGDIDAMAPWIITRRMVFCRGTGTTYEESRGRIVLNPYAFMVAKGYLYGRSCGSDVGHFGMTARHSRLAYERAGLAYPFIEPIMIARRGWKKWLTLGVNRLADTLFRVF